MIRIWRDRRPEALACLAATLFAACAFGFFAELPALRNAELHTLDMRFQLRGPRRPGPEIVLVMLDEPSIARLGRPPFSRALFADIVNRLHEAGARVVALDLLFSESQASLPPSLHTTLEKAVTALDDGAHKAVRAEIQRQLDVAAPDHAFAEAIHASGNVIAAYAFLFGAPAGAADVILANASVPPTLQRSAYRIVRAVPGAATPVMPVVSGVLMPIPEVAEAAAGLASVNVIYDTDGSLRFDPAVLRYGDDYFPTLPLAVVQRWWGLAPGEVMVETGRGLRFGDRFIPTDESMHLLVNYRGPEGTFPRVSLADVVAGRVPPQIFRDRIVLVGASALGLADTIVTPFSSALPRVERYASIADMILRGDALRRDDTTKLVDIVILLFAGLLVGTSCAAMSGVRATGVAAAATVGAMAMAYVAFIGWGVWLHVVGPVSMIGINFAAVTATRMAREEHRRRTAERALRESEERYALAARGANDGLWDWNLVTGRAYYSQRWLGMMGVPGSLAADSPDVWFERIHPDDMARVRERLDRHLAGERPRFRAQFRLRTAPSEPTLWMLVRGLAVRDPSGRPVRIAGSLSDVTAQRLAEDRLRRANIEAQAANTAKSEFLARMSHELRTPLNAIIGFSQMIAMELFGPIGSRNYRDYARDIQNSGTHLLGLISDVLDVSQIEARRMELRRTAVDLRAVIEQCVDMVRLQASEAGLRLTTALTRNLPQIEGDETKLKQVLLNFLSNAIKFGRRGGLVDVSAGLDADGGCWIAVSDDGIGIAAQDVERILQPFVKVAAVATAQYGGAGLGLSIAKALVDLHGGRMTITSQPNVGTTVRVQFPSERVIRGAAAPTSRRAAGA
ncbi:MAG TPA: CHASE2 domain-containing protein [Alphaproteobacteria bacterium]